MICVNDDDVGVVGIGVVVYMIIVDDNYIGYVECGKVVCCFLFGVMIFKVLVGLMDNNVYLVMCLVIGEILLIDVVNDVEVFIDLVWWYVLKLVLIVISY